MDDESIKINEAADPSSRFLVVVVGLDVVVDFELARGSLHSKFLLLIGIVLSSQDLRLLVFCLEGEAILLNLSLSGNGHICDEHRVVLLSSSSLEPGTCKRPKVIVKVWIL